MNRPRLAAVSALLAASGLLLGVVAEAGAASASDQPSPGPQSALSPSPAAGETNQPPVAVDDAATVTAGGSVTIPVLANDTDPEQQPLVVATVSNSRARISTSGTSVVFTARSTDRGAQVFDYTVSDGQATDTGRVTVTVSAPPVTRKVTISMAKPVVALRSYRIKGTVNLPLRRPVTVTVQRWYDGAWHTYRTDRADATGDWWVGFSSNRTKKYTLRALATWADGRKARSGTLSRTVVGRPDVKVSGPLGRTDVRYSYRAGCPVTPSGLRRISINRFTYAGTVARGSLVVRAGAVSDVLNVFRGSFSSRFPVHTMKPADRFYAGGKRTPTESDKAAMRADNTSAFNCRPVTGNPYRVSQHSYGNAIDINTVRNPYVVGSRVYPSFARTYLNRSNVRKGMITRGGVIATRFRNLGWPWGARWSHPDYQHFSSNGG
ncbi:MAG: cadherin-like domain-containing protein [Nocardioidaceae bacterium]|nr:cadherin-like domain-containing protein [Nocardioidaceae bacterium]NUS49730.1 cadherin-like domain-containing protein [Nocardioidaceae bacterium]